MGMPDPGVGENCDQHAFICVCVNISCTGAASIFDSRLMALIGSLEKHQGVPLQCAAAIKERAEPSMRCVVHKRKTRTLCPFMSNRSCCCKHWKGVHPSPRNQGQSMNGDEKLK